MKLLFRHGDVFCFQKVKEIPKEAKKLNRKELAYGEVTGHAHRVNDLVGELFESKNGDLFLKVDKLSHLTHEEHKTIVLKPAIYRIGIKRQYSPDGWENVRD